MDLNVVYVNLTVCLLGDHRPPSILMWMTSVCPDGNKPRTARYPTRGDYILAKGSVFEPDPDLMTTDTIYPYRKLETSDSKSKYECVSDHAILTWDVPLTWS